MVNYFQGQTSYTVECQVGNLSLYRNPIGVWLYFPSLRKRTVPPKNTDYRAGVLGARNWRYLFEDQPYTFTSIPNDPEIPEVIPVESGPTLAK